MAFDDQVFRRLVRQHEQYPELRPWAPTLCQEDHSCPRLQEHGEEAPPLDAVVVVLSPTLKRPAKMFADELIEVSRVRGVPLVWVLNYRQHEAPDIKSAVAAVRLNLADDERGAPPKLLTVNAKDGESVDVFVRELVTAMPPSVIEAFNAAVDDRFRLRRTEVLMRRIAHAAVALADERELRSTQQVEAVLAELKLALLRHYSVDAATWASKSGVGEMERAAAKHMQLPHDQAAALEAQYQQATRSIQRQEVGVSAQARRQVLRHFFSRWLYKAFGAFGDEVKQEEGRLRRTLAAHRQEAEKVAEAAKSAKTAAPDATRVCLEAFTHFATLLLWLDRREQPGPTVAPSTMRSRVEQAVSSVRDQLTVALELGQGEGATSILVDAGTGLVADEGADAHQETAAPAGRYRIEFDYDGVCQTVHVGRENGNAYMELLVRGRAHRPGKVAVSQGGIFVGSKWPPHAEAALPAKVAVNLAGEGGVTVTVHRKGAVPEALTGRLIGE